MDLVRFLFTASRGMVVGLVLASTLSGASAAALIALIHRALAPGDSSLASIAAGFAVALVAKAVTQYLSQLLLITFAQQVLLDLCRDICDRALAAPLDRLEAMGSARLLATLSDDVVVLSGAVLLVPSVTTNVAVLLASSIYLAWLSWPLFLLCLMVATFGVLCYRFLVRRAQPAMAAAREGRDRLFANYRTVIEGVKELKLHAGRREAFVRTEIDATTELLRRQNVLAMRQHLIADVSLQVLFFGLAAMLLFAAPAVSTLPTMTVVGFLFATLYMKGPLWALLGEVPTFMRGRLALAKIRELDSTLDAVAPRRAVVEGPPSSPLVSVTMDGATYAYPAPSSDEAGFVLGPIDLSLHRGELVFVTGGNGCGKSTLVRLIAGLYAPGHGVLRCNGVVIDDAGREAYRQHFAAVFADFHLFDRLFGLDAQDRADEITACLTSLGMAHKVSVRDDRLSTTALSAGQRRRLALLTAYLEDRPVYVFDEWAADQDPTYKQVFYTRLLPELKARGKCVVVVTHDDRFFAHGDRVVTLEGGRIVSDLRQSPPSSQTC